MPERFHFFWSGLFSQWAHSPFVIDNVAYGCAEQYMMAEKARLFGDEVRENLIMSNSDPRTQQRLGRQVQGYEQKVWDAHCQFAVLRASRAKYVQHEPSRKALLAIPKGRTLVEASPHDRRWGIGLERDDPRAQKRSTWKGTNWLGEILTRVRDEILAEQDKAPTLLSKPAALDQPRTPLGTTRRSSRRDHRRVRR